MSRASSTSRYPYHQDAVRIQAQQLTDGQEQCRRFSVDPQLTSFDILKNLIGRAFDMKGDFAISYRAFDDYGGETFLPMVSDWDLSAAFLSASDPDLQLMVEPKNIPLDAEDGYEDDPWEVIKSTEVIQDTSPTMKNFHSVPGSKSSNNTSNGRSMQNMDNRQNSQSVMPQSSNYQYPLNFNPKINTAGILNTMERWVQKAKTFVEDISVVTTRPPLSDIEFRNYLDSGGVLCRPRELRFACYHGGIEPSLRKVVWKHLLNVYPDGLSGNGRIEYVRNKAKDYYDLRDDWKTAIQNGQVSEDVMCISNMVRKDVLRTDRHLKFFAGHDDNQNIANLFNILTTYALNHPSVGYCQGMSDLASPLLVTMGDEAQAYICFCALMERINPNFNSDGLAMSLKFSHLAEALAFYDNFFWAYLKSIGADDLLFCYRWLLLEMKREFAFDDALRMMEVLWASLPYKPQDVPLFEVKFTAMSANAIPIPVPSLTSSYSKVCAIRRSSTASNTNELRQRRLSRKPRASPNLSLDENSLSSLSSNSTNNMRSHRKPFYSLDETMEILSSSEFFSSSPFEILSLSGANSPKPKLIKNLKEFWQIGRPKSASQSGESTPSSTSSKSSTVSNPNSRHNSVDLDMNGQSVFMDDLSEAETPREDQFTFSSGNKSSIKNSHPPLPSKPVNEVVTPTAEEDIGGAPVYKRSSETDNAFSVQNKRCDYHNSSYAFNANKSPTKKGFSETGRKGADGGAAAGLDGIDSENDSGHCCSESLEFDENSLEEPEFQTGVSRQSSKMPTPDEFGGANPFLMFLCLTLLLQHRDHITRNQMDYNETAMYFDKMIRKHNVARVLAHARQMYSNYLKQSVPRA